MRFAKHLAIAALVVMGLIGCATGKDRIDLPAGAATGGNPSSPMIPSTH